MILDERHVTAKIDGEEIAITCEKLHSGAWRLEARFKGQMERMYFYRGGFRAALRDFKLHLVGESYIRD